jgi:peptidoglycan/xylan/chitin deacetylase (PgdA/CDA1 family)
LAPTISVFVIVSSILAASFVTLLLHSTNLFPLTAAIQVGSDINLEGATPYDDTGQNYHNVSATTQKEIHPIIRNDNGTPSSNKLVIINFDDSYASQIIFAKPILDKYGFKATFFQICGRINERGWEDIAKLMKDGSDIQAHTMTHANLNSLSTEKLDLEIHEAKECFLKNGINTTVFAYPYGNGWNNQTVLKSVAKYYNLARTDSKYPLTFLNCDLWGKIPYGNVANESSNSMPSCISSENEDNGTRIEKEDTFSHLEQTLGSSKYAINSWSHKHIVGPYDYDNFTCIGKCQRYNNSQMFDRFKEAVDSQVHFNEDGTIRAIPIIVYHAFVPIDDIGESMIPTDTSVNLFEAEMKYLHDNDFKAITMKDLVYLQNTNTLSINGSRQQYCQHNNYFK